MLIDIISHAYAAKLQHYAAALTYQLSSLVLHPPKSCEVMATVCMNREDHRTRRVIDWFVGEQFPIGLRVIPLDVSRLGRRAIGRNTAALHTTADIVWFADVDQVYRDGVLDRLAALEWPEDAVMIFPRKIKIHCDHRTGDAATKLVGDEPRLIDINPDEFIDKGYNRAIGGVQCVRGDFAREHGYLNDHPKWQKPRDDGRPFGDFKDDLQYRGFCGRRGTIVGVDLPGMFRLRHLRTTYQ